MSGIRDHVSARTPGPWVGKRSTRLQSSGRPDLPLRGQQSGELDLAQVVADVAPRVFARLLGEALQQQRRCDEVSSAGLPGTAGGTLAYASSAASGVFHAGSARLLPPDAPTIRCGGPHSSLRSDNLSVGQRRREQLGNRTKKAIGTTDCPLRSHTFSGRPIHQFR